MRPSPKSEMMLYHEGEWELEAHTRSSCRTHEYFESWRDEFLTPSQCWDSEISCFAHWCWSKPNVNYLGNHHLSVMNSTNLFWSRKYEHFQLHLKQIFLSNLLFIKYSDLNFHCNRSSTTLFTRAIRRRENASKMSPNQGFHVMLQWGRSYTRVYNTKQNTVWYVTNHGSIKTMFTLSDWEWHASFSVHS